MTTPADVVFYRSHLCTVIAEVSSPFSAMFMQRGRRVRSNKYIAGKLSANAIYEFTHRYTNTHTHTQPFNGPFSRTTRVGRYQRGKTNLDFTEARDSQWQWHQLGHLAPDRQPHQHLTTQFFYLFITPLRQHSKIQADKQYRTQKHHAR